MAIVITIAILLFSLFVYDQAKLMQEIRSINHDRMMAFKENDKERLLEIEHILSEKMKSRNWQIQYKTLYLTHLYSLRMDDKIIEIFDKERASYDSIRLGISFQVCFSRYKLNRDGKACAEEIFNILKNRTHYYDYNLYWAFAMLADKKSEAKENMNKSKLPREQIEYWMSINIKDHIK